MLFFSAKNPAEVAISSWMLTFSVFIPLTVVAIQLGFIATFSFVLLVNFIEIGLQIHSAQATDVLAYLQQYNILLIFVVRFLVMTSMGHILSLLVKAYHDNQAKLQTANLELESLNHDLELHVLQRTTALNDTNQKTLEGWVRLLELRNFESRGHSERVCRLSTTLAEKLNRSTEEIEAIKYGAMLHDIGALGIPDPVLLKIEPLTALDWEIIKRHSEYGYQILQGIKFLEPSLDIVHYHHERLDGSGYPDGLKGNAIPWSARLFAVVDVYDALTSKRPYRAAWTIREAKYYLQNNAGKLFDPLIVTAFFGLLETEELDSLLTAKII
jgi:HD-GYP domain-containing protein (c-di-GMP phosphodiesterase class II)